MKNKKKIIETFIGLLIAITFLFITFRKKNINDIFLSINNANIYWMLLNGFFLLCSFYLRAIRWNILLENSNLQAKKSKIFQSVILGYFVNSFTPKFGEIIKCTSLNKSSNIPVSKSLGTVFTERIYDMTTLMLGLIIVFIIETGRFSNLFSKFNFNNTKHLIIYALIIIIAIGGLLLIILNRFSKNKIIAKLILFLRDFIATAKKSFLVKKYIRFILLTILIWFSLVLMVYCCLIALKETENFNLYFAFVALFVGSIGWVLPAPGGIGTSHFFVWQLFLIFNLSENAGQSFAVLSNGLTFIFCIIFGLIVIVFKYFKTVKNI